MELWDINTIKSVLEKNDFRFSKSLGQNFLANSSVCPRMAECALENGAVSALEVGPGIGILTKELALRTKKTVSVEIDKRLLPVLSQTVGEFNNLEIINDDILKIDINKLISEKFGSDKVAVCANLPYYITSPVIMYFLESHAEVDNLTVMVQKEAADRLCAEVGSRESGAVTVAVNYYAEAEKLFDVKRGSFIPRPNVDSAVIRLNIRKKPPVVVSDEEKFFRIVKSAFAQRRKTAVNSISAGMAIEKSDVIGAFEKTGIDVSVRAEKLTMEELGTLCECL